MAPRKNDETPTTLGTPAHRLDELEQRVRALEMNARTTEGGENKPALAPTTTQLPADYTNGMSTPDEIGRVKLERIEQLRRTDGARFLRANAALPAFAFVRAAASTFALNDVQRDHILMNTGDNARGGGSGTGTNAIGNRQGRAVRVSRDADGRYQEGDVLMDTIATFEPSAEGAAEEIIRKYEALAAGTHSAPYPTPGG